ncbi:DUF397 domain-containing protein [Kitasatospora herbaricolor]|uniref:DUF397 domain-containing protein n=1 Tax=Kitasatospora herbaricolor TaxID=68217 RepID=A0ABZ1W5C0_9ACTN|nr:DUF397 domain-containing protein [Kitasatospora herbaricolor]
MNADKSSDSITGLRWNKSSYSGGEGGECVEVAVGSGAVHVRDSKDRQGPQFSFGRAEWAAFLRFAVDG